MLSYECQVQGQIQGQCQGLIVKNKVKILVTKCPGLPRHKHKPWASVVAGPKWHGVFNICDPSEGEILVHVIVPHVKRLTDLIKCILV